MVPHSQSHYRLTTLESADFTAGDQLDLCTKLEPKPSRKSKKPTAVKFGWMPWLGKQPAIIYELTDQ